MKIIRKSIFLLLLFAGFTAFAQQEAIYSQYMFNQLVVNPAYAGSRDALSFTLVNRHQWVGLDGAPKTLTLSGHTPLRNESIAVGAYLFSDRLGPLHNYGFSGIYTYRIKIKNGRLAFGLQAGVQHTKIDWSISTVKDPDDPLWMNRPDTKPRLDANIGLYYSTDKFYVGISSKNPFENVFINEGRYDCDKYVFQTLSRHLFLMGGYAFEVSDDFVLRPSLLVKYTKNAPVNWDINLSAFFMRTLWVGFSYRTTNNALVFIAEVDITRSIRIGYSYDTYLSLLKTYNQGSHEIMVSYDLNIVKPLMLSPRYF